MKAFHNVLNSRKPLIDWATGRYTRIYQAIIANMSCQCTRKTKAHVTIYTDGSATYGAVARWKPQWEISLTYVQMRVGELTSSHKEEKAALLLAAAWVRAECPTQRIPICPGSISLLKALQSGTLGTFSTARR